MAIVQNDLAMVRHLVDLDPILLEHQAIGSFFSPGQPCYFGEYPLCFAACCNQKEMVRLFVQKGAPLNVQDSFGNSVFHLLVIHGLRDMYDFVEGLWKETRQAKSPSQLLNKEKLGPFTLAAKIGQKEMFVHLLEKEGTVITEWTYGPVARYLYPLKGLDYIPDADRAVPLGGNPRKTAIQLLVENEHIDLLELPRVQAVLHKKWDTWLEKRFFRRLFAAVAILLLFNCTIIYRGNSGGPFEALQGLLEAVLAVVALRKLLVELHEMCIGGLRGYILVKGSMFVENITSLVWSSCVCVVSGMHAVQKFELVPPTSTWDDVLEPILLAIAAIFGWSYILFFFLGFRLTGPFVVMIFHMLTSDVLRFVSIYSIFLMGFSTAFYVLWGQTGMASYVEQFEASFLMLVGGFETFWKASDESPNRTVAIVFLIFYILLVSILLVNLLIAMMGSTYSRISEAVDKIWLLEWARIIYTMEQEMSCADKEGQPYWVDRLEEDGTPARYIRVDSLVEPKWMEELLEPDTPPETQMQLRQLSRATTYVPQGRRPPPSILTRTSTIRRDIPSFLQRDMSQPLDYDACAPQPLPMARQRAVTIRAPKLDPIVRQDTLGLPHGLHPQGGPPEGDGQSGTPFVTPLSRRPGLGTSDYLAARDDLPQGSKKRCREGSPPPIADCRLRQQLKRAKALPPAGASSQSGQTAGGPTPSSAQVAEVQSQCAGGPAPPHHLSDPHPRGNGHQT